MFNNSRILDKGVTTTFSLLKFLGQSIAKICIGSRFKDAHGSYMYEYGQDMKTKKENFSRKLEVMI